jgi:Cu/Ag efflux protein CusF
MAGAVALAACGESNEGTQGAESGTAAQSNAMSGMEGMGGAQTAEPTGQVHSANGDITEMSSDSVTISHGPVDSIGWPAMTMSFQATSADMLQGLNVGDPVDFQFQQAGEQNVLSSISKAQQ